MREIFIATGVLLFAAIVLKFTVKRSTAFAAAADTAGVPAGALYPVKIKGKWGYINSGFQIQIAPQFSTAADFSDGLAAVSKEADHAGERSKEVYGYIDSAGSLLISCQYDKAYSFYEGYAVVVKEGKYGFIDKKGRAIIPCIYEEASRFSEGLACVKVNGKNGFIDVSGKMVIPPTYERACWVSDFSDGLAAVYTAADGGAGGYIDKSGKWIVQPVYSFVGSFSEGLALVKPQNGRTYGYINRSGDMIIPPVYDDGLGFHEGVATVKTIKPNGKTIFHVIDKTGKKISPDLPYLFAGIFCEGLAGVEDIDHRWGFINTSGKEVIAPNYAGVSLFHNGLARMETGSLFSGLKTIYINKKGQVVWTE